MSKGIDRRQFLNRTASTGAALGVALGTSTVRAAESPNNRVVVGVMGLSRGRRLAESFAREAGVEVRYVCDIDENRAAACVDAVEKAADQSPKPIGDFRRILDDQEVDALVCAAPNHWHAPATIMGCNAGKHVYVEKPCSHNPQEGEWMVQAARKNKRAVQLGTQRRSGDGIIEAIKLLHEGEIGKVYCARSYYSNVRGSIGKGQSANVPSHLDYELWQGPAPRVPYMDNRVHYNWHWFWHWGNGELGNNGVHSLDLCRWGMNVDYPIRVTSSGGRYRYDDDQQTPDTHVVAFEFDTGGLITWQGNSCNRFPNSFAIFFGEKGTLDLESGGNYTIYDERGRKVKEGSGKGRGDQEHIVNFVDAIRSDDPMKVSAEIEEGHKSTLLCHLGNIAHRTGRTLNCDPKNGHIVGDQKAMAYWQRDYEPGWEPKI